MNSHLFGNGLFKHNTVFYGYVRREGEGEKLKKKKRKSCTLIDVGPNTTYHVRSALKVCRCNRVFAHHLTTCTRISNKNG